jgi:two-component system, cell cycle sensor histidine kinase and response regulator CckA
MVLVDHEGKIVLVNRQTEKLFGYARQELLGQTIEILVPEASRKGHPTVRGDFVAQPQARPMGVGRDLHAQHKNGRQIPVEIGLNPIETEEGTWVLSSIVDITERQRAEAAMLRESEERFRNMADTAPVMIWVAGPDKLCTFFNKSWLEFTGRTMEEEMGNGWTENVHPDDLDRCVGTYSAAFDASRSFQMEYRLRRADGEYRWILDDGVPRIAPGGAVAGYIGSCIDITDVKHTLEAALASQKLETVGQLASGIAHDFNNLLGGILASAELGLAEHREGSSPEEELQRIRTAAIRGGEIVRQLMIYGGNESPAFEPVDVSYLVEEMLHLLKISISKHAILEIDLGEDLPAVNANPAQIRQVVMNLVTNASEAIGERDGVIRVTTSKVSIGLEGRAMGAAFLPAGDYFKLEVTDMGSGMTPEVQTRIFDPFFTTKFTGRGLGLATVLGIVRGHGGAVNVVSSLGHGTRFEVLLPCGNQAAWDHREIAPRVSASDEGKVGGTILVVEDEDMLRLATSKILRRKGFSVIEAIDGTTAIDLFRDNGRDIAVVLLDMTLPGRNGQDVFAELRRMRPDVKVILTSAYSHETILAVVGDLQGSDFIRKPYRLSDLVTLVRKSTAAKGA